MSEDGKLKESFNKCIQQEGSGRDHDSLSFSDGFEVPHRNSSSDVSPSVLPEKTASEILRKVFRPNSK